MSTFANSGFEDISFENLYAADQVATRLNSIFSTLSPHHLNFLFYHRVRTKSVQSIRDKLYKKRFLERETNYTYQNITDVVGVRIVALKDEDLNHCFDLMESLVRHGQNGHQPIFSGDNMWVPFTEANIYHRKNRSGTDPDIYETFFNYIKDNITQNARIKGRTKKKTVRNITDKINYGPAGAEEYSSAHFNFLANSYDKIEIQNVPIEIQIRTSAEDIWSEINHKLLYKSRNPYIWTPELHRTTNELHDDSDQFKGQIEALSKSIQRFVQHSEEVQSIRKRFKEPDTKVHKSLVFSLFFAASTRFTIDKNSYFDAYEDAVVKLRETFGKQAFASEIKTAKDCLENIVLDIDEFLSQENMAEADIMLCEQRKHLVSFENTRLDILHVLSEISDIKLHSPSSKEGDLSDENLNKLNDFFDELCDIKNSKDLAIRPVAAISYWKYLCQRNLSKDKALHYVKVAREELKYDDTLPVWSIYRVLIPRSLSRELFSIVIDILKKSNIDFENEIENEDTKINLSSLQIIHAYLVEILDNSLLSYYEILNNDSRRGDLIFGRQNGNKYGDEETILYTYIIYYLIFEDDILKQRKSFKEDFERLYTSLRHRLRQDRSENPLNLVLGNKINRIAVIRRKLVNLK